MTTGKDALDRGDTNQLGALALATGLGSVVSGEKAYVRQVRETLTVAAGVPAAPSYNMLAILFAQTIGTAAAGAKQPASRGTAPGVGGIAPNAGGTAVVVNAETTGNGTLDVVYLTGDPPKGRKTLVEELPGFVG